ncbi:hypothetical protein GSI_08466 [Ganoderma sinense ZZ0214-1]|uniref:Uncharacterized protein n=1 Tax=Ganoderma sinense ZZ0214-1 TaxID=1077348 RepID=A0A2G8S3T7_9APHY|nr:hypothetical protein GSI_08466 [Ganoderma sinense ZZ0214-1]
MPPQAKPPKPTDLTDTETAYLESCIVNYRSTPTGDKEDFRDNCVRYIMRGRSLADHEFTFEHFSTKVRNWFQNHTGKGKTESLPININQHISAKRAWAIVNEKTIRESVEKRKAEAGGDERFHLNTWNDVVRQLWEEVPEAEQAVYECLTQKWLVEGPDESVKSIIAQKRAPKWLRSVTHLFWHQCNMPIFIYGMYKDKDGDLHAAVYDTSKLWREDDKTTPLLRNILGWDQDFRRVAWNFFQATLRPDLAAAETLQVMKAAKRLPPATFQFNVYPDKCPILVDTENGKVIKGSRMQEVFREYMKAHYNLAAGREMRAPPWGSLTTNTSKFFAEGMLPDGFQFNDPSHINAGFLGDFYTHVIEMEKADPLRRFRFSHYEIGSGDNRQYHPAVYNGAVEAAAPRRAKKGIAVPEFEDPPSPPADDNTSLTNRSTASPAPVPLTVVPPLQDILAAHLQAARIELEAERTAVHGSQSDGGHMLNPTHSTTPQLGAANHPSSPSEEAMPWLDAEIDAAAHRTDNEFGLTDDEFIPEPTYDDGSDDEVENVLVAELVREAASVLSTRNADSHAQRPPPMPHPIVMEGSSTAAVTPAPAPSTSQAAGPAGAIATVVQGPLLPPCDAGSSPSSRLVYLQGLADDAEYIALLERLQDSLQVVVPVRAQNPVFWGTWGHRSPHVPQAVHASEKKTGQLLQWISKTRDTSGSAADIQRFCLVIGLTLRDMSLLASIDGTSM